MDSNRSQTKWGLTGVRVEILYHDYYAYSHFFLNINFQDDNFWIIFSNPSGILPNKWGQVAPSGTGQNSDRFFTTVQRKSSIATASLNQLNDHFSLDTAWPLHQRHSTRLEDFTSWNIIWCTAHYRLSRRSGFILKAGDVHPEWQTTRIQTQCHYCTSDACVLIFLAAIIFLAGVLEACSSCSLNTTALFRRPQTSEVLILSWISGSPQILRCNRAFAVMNRMWLIAPLFRFNISFLCTSLC